MELLPTYVIVAMLITLLVLYFISPEPKIIIKYPTVDDAVSGLYVDDNNICYKYHRKETSCNNAMKMHHQRQKLI